MKNEKKNIRFLHHKSKQDKNEINVRGTTHNNNNNKQAMKSP